ARGPTPERIDLCGEMSVPPNRLREVHCADRGREIRRSTGGRRGDYRRIARYPLSEQRPCRVVNRGWIAFEFLVQLEDVAVVEVLEFPFVHCHMASTDQYTRRRGLTPSP